MQCLDHDRRMKQALHSQCRQWNQHATVRPTIAKSARKTGDFVMEIQVLGDSLAFHGTGLSIQRQYSGKEKWSRSTRNTAESEGGRPKWMVNEVMNELNVELKYEDTWTYVSDHES